MQRTLIIGASGQIGKKLTQLMLEKNQQVTALVRDKSKLSDLDSDKLSIVEGDLSKDFEHAYKNCNKIVFVAGSGGHTGADQTILIDLWAACRAADYAIKHDVKHFIMVSSIGADQPSIGSNSMQPYLVAKHMADEHLINSGLCYSIIRPSTLTNEAATAKFTSQRPEQKEQAIITRDDVAEALLFCISTPPKKSAITELFNGNKKITEIF
ncbi:NAD(P)-binding oxidoreductase [Paraglaciecola aquimarina]|uniref:NAD(P)-binding oxidoreductase n=1 Tax=Paraglaciecola aquimarina TaxID=1235557 RepID=A0ABU3ST52_9ALTE|nr:NAD(P)-binding oxidoreductase [Paraglaciecola aquimarina]MDU0353191.1 NAD(P)-binding oxidoreductase [Paraglaciecola aquimarina]